MKSYIRKIFKRIKVIARETKKGNYSYYYWMFPINNKKIVICNYYGKGYGDNSKYIVEEANKVSDKFEFVWLVNNVEDYKNVLPRNVRAVKYGGFKSKYELATAKVWIDNCRKFVYPPKRKQQKYIQTWHSPLRLKTIEKDAEKNLSPAYIRSAKRDSKICDYIISGCDFSSKIFLKSFWYSGEILRYGTPRCDIFFDNEKTDKNSILEKIGIDNDIRIVLYAPTFRNTNDAKRYDIDYNTILDVLQNKFGDTWKMLIRLHPNESHLASQISYDNRVLNASDYDDMQELLYTVDVLITDYSSSMFDIAIAKKMCFLYTPDVSEYQRYERKLYFDFNELPFSTAQSIEELRRNIDDFNYTSYHEGLTDFLKTIGSYETGNASSGIVQLLDTLIS